MLAPSVGRPTEGGATTSASLSSKSAHLLLPPPSAAAGQLGPLRSMSTAGSFPSAAVDGQIVTKSVVRLARPQTVPPPPFALTPHLIDVSCQLGEVREVLERALRDSNVDYEYNDAKWKVRRREETQRGSGRRAGRTAAAQPLAKRRG